MDVQGMTPAPGAGPEPAPGPTEPARRRLGWPARIAVGFSVLLAVAVLAGFVVRVPYTTIAPGEAVSLPPLVSVQGTQAYPSGRGDIRLLFVREAYHVNFWQYVRARLDSDIDVAKDSAVNPGDLTARQQEAQGLQQMADAKSAATSVALRAAGYKVGVLPGLVVSDLVDKDPAIKVLFWGDVILRADGRTLNQATDLSAAIAKHTVGQQVTLAIVRDGKAMTVHVGITAQDKHKFIGVVVSPRFTFPVKVDVVTTGIGGPSAGLAMTLAILDDLTPGNLTGGARVAVTGTIDNAGNVGEIGGIQQKAVAARAAGVSMFIVPQCSPDDPPLNLASCKADLARAAKRAGSKIKIVPVLTFRQALDALRAAGGAPVTPTGPTTTTSIVA